MVRIVLLYPLRNGKIKLPHTLFNSTCSKWVLKVLMCICPTYSSIIFSIHKCLVNTKYDRQYAKLHNIRSKVWVCEHGVYVQIDVRWPFAYKCNSIKVDRHLLIMCISWIASLAVHVAVDLKSYCYYIIYFYKGSYMTTHTYFSFIIV